MPADKKKIHFIFILVFSLLAGCSPMIRYKVLSFFFDGVPNPSERVLVNSKDSLSKTDSIYTKAIASKKMEPDFFFHPPYRDKKCGSCHESIFSNRPVKPVPDLCYICHDDFNNKYKTLHGPVASGYCLKCHNQHLSKLPKLLLRSGQDLCLYCHNAKQVFQNKVHEHVRERNCTDCHSPHGGENRGMLKPGSCYNCHENFNNKFKTLHGPVSSGYCTACHGSHETKVKKLLLRENQQLCLYCHNQKHILKNAAHKDIIKSKCTKCHNPHGGEERFILIQPALSSDMRASGKEKMPGDMDSLPEIKPYLEAKLYIINKKSGDTLVTAGLNNDGFFVFDHLPVKQDVLFRLGAREAELIDEIQALYKDEHGKDTIITLSKRKNELFGYEYLPQKKARLYLVNNNGDTLMKSTPNEEGFFVFNKLPSNKNHIFLLDAENNKLTNELLILLIDEKGEESMITASKVKDNLYKSEYIPQLDESKLALLEQTVVPVTLEEKEEKNLKVAFDNLEFNFGSNVIKFNSYTYLAKISQLLIKNPEWHIMVSSHTDNVGSEKYNLMLSQNRGEAIKRVLINRGVTPERIIVKYFGETKPVADNSTEEGRQKNRRMELLIIKSK